MSPGFLSSEFHLHFFPALLKSRLSPVKKAMAGFMPPIFDQMIVLFICGIFLLFGLPGALSHNSVTGWILSGIGGFGMAAIVLNSITSREDAPNYNDFLIGVFFFFLLLGPTAGIFVGAVRHAMLPGIVVGAGGLIAGYLVGILAGLYLQYLGWIALMVNFVAGLAIIGMVIVDMVLLAGVLS